MDRHGRDGAQVAGHRQHDHRPARIDVRRRRPDGVGSSASLVLDRDLHAATQVRLQPAIRTAKLERALADQLPAAGRPDQAAPSTAGETVLAYLRTQTEALKAADPMVRTDEPDAFHTAAGQNEVSALVCLRSRHEI